MKAGVLVREEGVDERVRLRRRGGLARQERERERPVEEVGEVQKGGGRGVAG